MPILFEINHYAITDMKKVLALLFVVLTIASCNEKTPQDLFNEQKSGVVLILNEYYYTLTMPNGNNLYFTGIGSDQNLENITFDEEEIKKQRQVMSGTGFFVNNQGLIMTNRHVAQPQIDLSDVKNGYNNLVSAIKQIYRYRMQQLSDQYDELESSKSDCYGYDYWGNYTQDTQKMQEIESQQQELSSQFTSLGEAYQSMDDNVSISDLKISSNCLLGIAYNDTYITSDKDFIDKNPCVFIRAASQESTDLALIQLKNKKTPEDAYIFNTDGIVQENIIDKIKNQFDKDDGTLKIDQSLYMIGYNAGPTLATTKQGIQVQMTSGKLSQLPDGERVLYSIPTVQGSSGSPVIDEKGRLVAVNFAKLVGSDNFNFGIPMNKIKNFIKQ